MKYEQHTTRLHAGRSHTAAGFTLIELMVVVVIIGIIVAIAYPSYNKYVIRSNRAAAQAFMMDVANREKQFLLDARQYIAAANHTELSNNLKLSVPTEVSKFYNITVAAPNVAPPTFTITAAAVPGLSQASDGNLTLAHDGTTTGNWK